MRFCVSVPVLSVQSIVVAPSASIKSARLMRMRCESSRRETRLRTTTTLVGRPSGTLATIVSSRPDVSEKATPRDWARPMAAAASPVTSEMMPINWAT